MTSCDSSRIATLFILLSQLHVVVSRAKCGASSFHLGKSKPSQTFIEPIQVAPLKCSWSINGDVGCVVDLYCKMSIRKMDENCTHEFLRVTDGTGSSLTYCGRQEFHHLRASREGLRDLFLVLETLDLGEDDPEEYFGVECTAQCARPYPKRFARLPNSPSREIDSRCGCGWKNHGDRVVGGGDTAPYEYPWQVAIVFANTRAPFCGGTVINDRFVLTAAHCFFRDKTQPEEIEILVHAHDLDISNFDKTSANRDPGYVLVKDMLESTQRYKVKEIISHPLFGHHYDFDYALLRLDRNINLQSADAPTPVCLPEIDAFDTVNLDRKRMTVLGWGFLKDKGPGSSPVLQKLVIPQIPDSSCASWYHQAHKEVTKRMFCAGYNMGGKDTCQGDSGGPILLKSRNGQFFQFGIVSWGIGCAKPHRPGVYSRLTEMMQWIHFHSLEHNAIWCLDGDGKFTF